MNAKKGNYGFLDLGTDDCGRAARRRTNCGCVNCRAPAPGQLHQRRWAMHSVRLWMLTTGTTCTSWAPAFELDVQKSLESKDKDWRQASSRAKLECWNKDKKRTTRQQVDIGFTGAAKLDTSRRGTQRSPARPATASFFFLRENPNSTLLGEQGGITIQYYL